MIDSGVDTAWVRERIKAREGEAALASLDPDRLMGRRRSREAYWQLYQQPRDAWTFEQKSVPSAKHGDAMNKIEFHFDFGSPNAYLSHPSFRK